MNLLCGFLSGNSCDHGMDELDELVYEKPPDQRIMGFQISPKQAGVFILAVSIPEKTTQ